MTPLHERLAAASIDDARPLLEELYKTACPDVGKSGYVSCFNYIDLLNFGPEGYLSAVAMLVPEDLEWEVCRYDPKRDPRFGNFQSRICMMKYEDDPEELGPQSIANASHPALALASAVAKSLEP